MTNNAIPKYYRLVVTTTTCTHCGARSHDSQFLAAHAVKSRHDIPSRHDAGITILPCDRPLYNLPVERMARTRTTPYCHACSEVNLSHLPPVPTISNVRMVQPTPVLKSATKPAAPAKPKPSIFDLA
jgi:hypothetical protein